MAEPERTSRQGSGDPPGSMDSATGTGSDWTHRGWPSVDGGPKRGECPEPGRDTISHSTEKNMATLMQILLWTEHCCKSRAKLPSACFCK